MTAPTFPGVSQTPDYGSTTQLTAKANVWKAQFGDGYSQRARTGLNNVDGSYALQWSALTKDDRDSIVGFLQARGGDEAFYFTRPRETVPALYTCDTWVDEQDDYDAYLVTATFTLVFDLDG